MSSVTAGTNCKRKFPVSANKVASWHTPNPNPLCTSDNHSKALLDSIPLPGSHSQTKRPAA